MEILRNAEGRGKGTPYPRLRRGLLLARRIAVKDFRLRSVATLRSLWFRFAMFTASHVLCQSLFCFFRKDPFSASLSSAIQGFPRELFGTCGSIGTILSLPSIIRQIRPKRAKNNILERKPPYGRVHVTYSCKLNEEKEIDFETVRSGFHE